MLQVRELQDTLRCEDTTLGEYQSTTISLTACAQVFMKPAMNLLMAENTFLTNTPPPHFIFSVVRSREDHVRLAFETPVRNPLLSMGHSEPP